jgi:hypothetical protein
MKVASISVGAVGIVIGLIPILGLFAIVLGVLGVIFGAVARTKLGLVLSIGAIAMGILGFVIVDDALNDLENDLDQIEQEWNDSIDDLNDPVEVD